MTDGLTQDSVYPKMLLRSNHGAGPLIAEVIGVFSDGSVRLDRWDSRSKSKRRTPFSLSLDLLCSPRCAWRPV